jgi:hypothetical protein
MEKFEALQSSLSKFGAYDTEPCAAFNQLIRIAILGKGFPNLGYNFFELYESVPGWEEAHDSLVSQARLVFDVIQNSTIKEVQAAAEHYGW